MERYSHRQVETMCLYLDEKYNFPSLTDHYLMKLQREVWLCSLSDREAGARSGREFQIPFLTGAEAREAAKKEQAKKQKPKLTREQMIEMARSNLLARHGLNKDGKRDGKRDGNRKAGSPPRR